MGLFGKLFEKKECAICGGEIGLLGNRKLEDGNMCKNCAAKLSPWMTDRRQSTVAEIEQHLAYREENQRRVPTMRPTRVYGQNRVKLYIDEEKKQFFVTAASNWRDANPDIIDIGQVLSCSEDIRENKEEITHTDKDGKKVSFNPKRYKVSYRFYIEIRVDSPFFSEIRFELSDQEPESPYNDLYREYERQAGEMRSLLDPSLRDRPMAAQPAANTFARDAAMKGAAPAMRKEPEPARDGAWKCPSCGARNEGRFCANCGQPKPEPRRGFRCNKCGWTPAAPTNPPKFCPQCGDRFDNDDLA